MIMVRSRSFDNLCGTRLERQCWRDTQTHKQTHREGQRVCLILTLSLRRGGCCNPPFPIFPRTIFAFLLRLPYGQFTHPLSRHPCIYEKNFQKFLPWKKLGGGEVATTPPRYTPPLLRGKGWENTT